MNLNKLSSGLLGLGGAFLGVGILRNFIYRVEPGERAIIFDKFGGGIKESVMSEGYHFYIPVKQEVIKYDAKIRAYDYRTFTGTKDL